MKILVDADAMPNPIKTVLFRAADRVGIRVVLVANEPLRVPNSPYIESFVVEAGPDIADDWIADNVEPEDLAVTADIPLADRVVGRGALALDPRGQLHTAENIKNRLAMRDLMDEIRNTGLNIGGPPPFNKKDVKAFADQLDAWLTRSGLNRDCGGHA